MGIEIINDLWSLAKFCVVVAVTAYVTYKITRLIHSNDFVERDRKAYSVIHSWFIKKQNNENTADWFKNNGYRDIAIYGNGHLGKLLLNELKNTGVSVKYIIDKNAVKLNGTDAAVVTYKDIPYMDKVDAIVITAPHIYDDLAENVRKMNCEIKTVSIEEIVS